MRAVIWSNNSPPLAAGGNMVVCPPSRKTCGRVVGGLSRGRLQVVDLGANTSERRAPGASLWGGKIDLFLVGTFLENVPRILVYAYEGGRAGEQLSPLERSGKRGTPPTPPENLCRYAT